MKRNTRWYLSAAAAGALLAGAALWAARTFPAAPAAVPGFFGLAGGLLFFCAMAELLSTRDLDPARRERDREDHDERGAMIRAMARARAGDVLLWLLLFGAAYLYFFDVPKWVNLILLDSGLRKTASGLDVHRLVPPSVLKEGLCMNRTQKKRLFQGLLAMGIVLLVLSLLLDGRVPDSLGGMLCGIGSGLLAMAGSTLLNLRHEAKHPEMARQHDIEQKDERNVAIRNRAKAVSGEVLQWSVLAAAWLSIGLDAPLWVPLAATGVFVAKSVLELYLMIRYEREM
ncbi:hypothetical protein [Dysosmobacter welbionis]|uniref:hypothetical protein n=2 Tax=Eubacteriales TaxID=186802 RepID=UPI00300F26C0